MSRTIVAAWGAEDRARAERGARHVRRLAEWTAKANAGNLLAVAILGRFYDHWHAGTGQWQALEQAERETFRERDSGRMVCPDCRNRPDVERCDTCEGTGSIASDRLREHDGR